MKMIKLTTILGALAMSAAVNVANAESAERAESAESLAVSTSEV